MTLTLLLLNTSCPVLVNSVDPDQLASEEANWSGSALFVIKYVNFYKKNSDQVIWLAGNQKWALHLNLFSIRTVMKKSKQTRTDLTNEIKALTAPKGRLSLSVGSENGPEDVSINVLLLVIYENSEDWSDAAFCGVWSGYALFANVPA